MSYSSPESDSQDINLRGQRRWNPIEEVFFWSSTTGQLLSRDDVLTMKEHGFDISGFDTVLQFPPGSYVQLLDPNGFIYGPASEGNEFIKVQRCVEGCRFSTENKKPAVIREHFATCKMRLAKSIEDPLARLCALQLGQYRLKNKRG